MIFLTTVISTPKIASMNWELQLVVKDLDLMFMRNNSIEKSTE